MRSVTEAEPEWDDDDRALMQALAIVEADQCPGCGGSLTETTTAEAAERHYPIRVRTCHRCVALAEHQDARKDAYKPHTLRFAFED